MNPKQQAKQNVQTMYNSDGFSQWLGIQIVHVEPGNVQLKMTVRKEMTNGFGIAHGGISYSFADSALAFASNGHDVHCVSIETSISHLAAIHVGDELTALATEIRKANKVAWYRVEVRNQHDEIVAQFNGTVYRTSKSW